MRINIPCFFNLWTCSPEWLNDTHAIPENKNKEEGAHFHHDFMFVFYVKDENVLLDQNEVSDFTWVNAGIVMKEDSNMSKALRKMKKLDILRVGK